ncbi:MAG: PAS domain S-box protein [Chloroflexi bacterium]|nr:MAG: PAS domain S-box protein [Chloroflexota bacterium]
MSALRGGRRQKRPAPGNGAAPQPDPSQTDSAARKPVSSPSDQAVLVDSVTSSTGRAPDGLPSLLLSALVLLRCVSIIAFGAAALMSFTTFGSRLYTVEGLQQALAIALTAAGIMAAFASWLRYRSGRSSQSLLLFVAFAGLAALYLPLAVVHTAGPTPAHLLFAPLSRLIFAIGLLGAVLGLQVPSLTRLPPWLAATLVVLVACALDAVIYSRLGTFLQDGLPQLLLERAEPAGLLVNLVVVICVVRVWWKTRRPFLIYLIGAICALTLGGSLFLTSDPWEGRWWTAHLGMFVSAIAVTEGVVAERSRRGRLSEVMDLGGLSRLAEGTVDAMRDGLALHDATGHLVGWNPAAERITGWRREMAALRLSPTLPEGMVELPDGKCVDVRHFSVRQNGYHYLATLFTDVTERMHAEKALRDSEERYRSLVEVSPDAVILMELEGTIRLCNRRAAALQGYESGEELLNKNFFDLVAPDDRERALANAMRIVQEGGVRDVEYQMLRSDGSHFSAELSASIIRDLNGKPRAVTAVFRDVSDRKRTQQALSESEERYRGLVEASPDAVAFTDVGGKILLCNKQAAALHGFGGMDDLLGHNRFELIAPEDRGSAIALLARTLETGVVSRREYELLRRDGSRFPGEISASRILDREGRPMGLTMVWRDITERRHAEEEIHRTSAFIDLLRSVAVAANEATNLNEALTSSLRHICERIGWPAGHAYLVSNDSERPLVSSGVWYPEVSRRLAALRAATADTGGIAVGQSLAGQVLETGKPAWTRDLRDCSFARGEAARAARLAAAFAFPLRVGGEVAGVLEFFSSEFEAPDESLLEVMASIGTTLGRVIERKRARDEIDRAFTLSQDMLAIIGFDGEFRRANPTFCGTLHFTESELMAIPYIELVHPEDLNAFGSELHRLASGSPVKGFEMRMRGRDGSYRWTQWNGTPFPSERVIYAHGRDITERKRTEEALLNATDEIRDLYNAAPCGYHSLDSEGVFVRINDTELEWLGYKRSEVIGKKKMADVLTPAGKKAFAQSLREFQSRGWMRAVEIEMSRKNGTTFPALLSASAVADVDGKFLMTRSTVFDITERKRAEEELRESESRARAIVNTAQDAFVAIDQSGRITDWNPQAEATFGWTRKEALGRKLAQKIIPARFRRGHKLGLQRFMRTGVGPLLNNRIEVAAVDKEGREFPVEVTISPLQTGAEYIFNSFIHDITERKQAEAMRARLAAIVESSDDAIIGTNLSGEITSWNKAATRLFRYSMREAIGKRITMLTPPDLAGKSSAAPPIDKSSRGVEHFETARMRKNGSRVDVSMTVSPILDAEGAVIGASTIARDVTARKRAEELARRAEDLARSNADLEQFAYVASHDLQEPLRMVTGYCDLLQRRYKGKLDSDADDFITFAAEGAQRMQELVRGLLEYSRVGPHAKIDLPVDSGQAFERAVANLRVAIDESGVTIKRGRLPTVLADATQLEHVFQNLIGNAIKFRGPVTPRVDIKSVRQDGIWLFSVKDNGIGIDMRYADKVFAIFQRLHGRGEYAGTGLGLAICKKIIERHGGNIWFESKPGHGTTFYFTLPARGGNGS